MNKLLGIATALILGVIVMLIINSYQIHWDELDWKLQKVSLLDAKVTSVHMIGKLTNQQRIFFDEINQSQMDKEEVNFQRNLKFHRLTHSNDKKRDFDFFDDLNKTIINAIRKLTSVDLLPNESDIKGIHLLSEAFLLESQYEYQKAIKLYDHIIESGVTDSRLLSTAILHKGFCLSMLNQVSKANLLYDQVIQNERDNDLGFTAYLLLQYQKTIEREKLDLLKSNIDLLEQAKKLVQIQQCNSADSIINKITNPSQSDQSQISFLRGKCSEYIGEKVVASKHYLKSISDGGSKETSKDANRRLLMLGKKLNGPVATQIKQMATSINEVLKDSAFLTVEKAIASDDLLLKNNSNEFQKGLDSILSSAIKEDLKMVQSFPDLPIDSTSAFSDTNAVKSTTSTEDEDLNELFKSAKASITMPAEIPDESLVVKNEVTYSNPFKWQKGEIIDLNTSDGRVFRGQLVSSPNAKVIRIETMIGVIGIPRSQLRGME